MLQETPKLQLFICFFENTRIAGVFFQKHGFLYLGKVFLCEIDQTSTVHVFSQKDLNFWYFLTKHGFLYLGKVFLCEMDQNFNFTSVKISRLNVYGKLTLSINNI